MKKFFTTIIIAFCTLLCAQLAAQSWEKLGGEPASSSETNFTAIAISDDGTIYIAYKEGGPGGNGGYRAAVQKFNGTEWEQVGEAGFTINPVISVSIAVDADGIPYVAYKEEGNGYKAQVSKFDGENWVGLDYPTGISAGEVSNFPPVVKIADDNTVFVSYRDHSLGYKACVSTWNGNTWETVGDAAFSEAASDLLTMALTSDGTPYVAFKDENDGGYKVSVMKFNGEEWEYVGGRSSSTNIVGNTMEIAIGADDLPVVAYNNEGNGNKLTVMKFDGENWNNLGETTISAGEVTFISLAIGQENVPYVAYRDHSMGYKAFVQAYKEDAWGYLGSDSEGYSDGASDYNRIAIDDSKIYTVLADESLGMKANVWVYDEADPTAVVAITGQGVFDYYNNCLVYTGEKSTNVTVYNYCGLKIAQYNVSNSAKISLENLPTGIYIAVPENNTAKSLKISVKH
jgi:hypothetical protein